MPPTTGEVWRRQKKNLRGGRFRDLQRARQQDGGREGRMKDEKKERSLNVRRTRCANTGLILLKRRANVVQ